MSNIKETVLKVLKSEIPQEFEDAPFHIVKFYLESEGYKYLHEEFDQNGWQVDFWSYFARPESIKDPAHGNLNRHYTNVLCVSGSLLYGGLKIQKHENEEDE